MVLYLNLKSSTKMGVGSRLNKIIIRFEISFDFNYELNFQIFHADLVFF